MLCNKNFTALIFSSAMSFFSHNHHNNVCIPNYFSQREHITSEIRAIIELSRVELGHFGTDSFKRSSKRAKLEPSFEILV